MTILILCALASCKQPDKCTFLGEKLELGDPKESYPRAPKEMYRFLDCGMDSIDCELMLPFAAVLQMDRMKDGRPLRYGDVKEAFDHMKDKNKDEYKASKKEFERKRH